MNIAIKMESIDETEEKQMTRWRRIVKQLRHALLTRFSRALRKRWAEFHFLPVRVNIIDNPAYRGASVDKYKLVKLADESDADMYMYTADEERTQEPNNELHRALSKIAMRPNSVVMIRGLNYHVPGDCGSLKGFQ